MDDISIRHCFEEIQPSLWSNDKLVFCPMCEVLHENNSNCQRND